MRSGSVGNGGVEATVEKDCDWRIESFNFLARLKFAELPPRKAIPFKNVASIVVSNPT